MSAEYQYRSVRISNFRGFTELDVQNLKGINLFGGFNGVGKSSLLETIFFTMDVTNPVAIMKPFSWRNATIQESDVFILLKEDGCPADIETIGSRGDAKIKIERMAPPEKALVTRMNDLSASNPKMATSLPPSSEGLQITATWLNQRLKNFIIPDPSGFFGASLETTNPGLPTAIYFSGATRSPQHETATRLTQLIRQKRLNTIVEPLRMFQKDLQSFSIMQYGAESTVSALIDGEFCPVNLLGDGFRNLFEVVLGISSCTGGCVLLDEIDASFHYSIVSKAWEVIAAAAQESSCQIFASSHSRETIMSAAEGVRNAGREEDFSYNRLLKKDGRHIVTQYNFSDLKTAEEFNFEFR